MLGRVMLMKTYNAVLQPRAERSEARRLEALVGPQLLELFRSSVSKENLPRPKDNLNVLKVLIPQPLM